MPGSDYWVKRATANRDYAESIADTYIKRQSAAFKRAYSDIMSHVEGLEKIGMYGGNLSRAQLWEYSKYRQMLVEIENQVGIVHNGIISDAESMMRKIFRETIGRTLGEYISKGEQFNVLSKQLLAQALNTNWAGANYSTRIWNNTNQLASKIKDSITRMVLNGDNIQAIRREVMYDLNVSYNVADRLLRTEAMHTYNTASLASYQAAGVEKVELISCADASVCKECADQAGIYPIKQAPTLPTHPNCRCCFAGVSIIDQLDYGDTAEPTA